MRSIRNRLLGWLGAAVVAGGLAIVGVSYRVTLKEIGEGMDESLKQVAVAMATYGGPAREQHQALSPRWPLPEEPSDEYDVVTLMWNIAGELTYASDPKIQLPRINKTGLSIVESTMGEWHVYTIANESGFVMAAQRTSSRRIMAADSASSLFLPLLGLIAFMGFTLVGALKYSLQPLEAASREVQSRSTADLQPLDPSLQPKEIQPLVRAINALFQRLSTAFEAREKFVADAAHEMRSPVTALRLQLQLLERTASASEKEERLLALKAGMSRTERLIGQLLNLSQVDSDKESLKLESMDLAELAREVVTNLSGKAEQRSIDLGVDAPSAVWVSGDKGQLDLLLVNLVENALRYTPRGGIVDVRARMQGKSGLLEVVDNGPGIPPDEQKRVFDRFYRGSDAGQAEDPVGSGLGLAIVKAVAERHHASVSLRVPEGHAGLLVRVSFAATPDPGTTPLQNA